MRSSSLPRLEWKKNAPLTWHTQPDEWSCQRWTGSYCALQSYSMPNMPRQTILQKETGREINSAEEQLPSETGLERYCFWYMTYATRGTIILEMSRVARRLAKLQHAKHTSSNDFAWGNYRETNFDEEQLPPKTWLEWVFFLSVTYATRRTILPKMNRVARCRAKLQLYRVSGPQMGRRGQVGGLVLVSSESPYTFFYSCAVCMNVRYILRFLT